MPSREERGEYGTANKVRDWSKYNPWGYKTVPFPEEQVCSFCESKCDVIFPIAPKVCVGCAQKIAGRTDVAKSFKSKVDFTGYLCDNCGRTTFTPIIVNTRICHKCTLKIGEQTKKNYVTNYIGRRVI